jgi:ribosomal protein S4
VEALSVMGHMALLRNVRNFLKNEVPISLWGSKLLEGVEKGKQFPFRYISAMDSIRSFTTVESNEARPVPTWLEKDAEKLSGKVVRLASREDIDLPVEEHLIVELYSK